ncbi:MAG: TdeIII family type II restriction endonuclease [Thermocrinis sp.]|jgi:hypothetical protein|uniref:TdeIII family type II restriction endonuclease n=1 Tax=Thermocrinis sp. TaxID=2024383 RepID=UPI003C01D088
MSLTEEQKRKIEEMVERSLLEKLKRYKPETFSMPFHYRLLGKDRMALYSFIQSLNTTFGTSIFEPVAEVLASFRFSVARRQFVVGNRISQKAQEEIQNIINELSSGARYPNKEEEIERIRKVAKEGKAIEVKSFRVDLFLKDKNGSVHLFDLKTAKPNIGEFKNYKRTLLEWVAIYLWKEPSANINSYIAIPYNPYEPEPYQRWTMRGVIDIERELKVAEEFWDFLGGDGSYEELLNCFERVGIKLRPVLDRYFSKFRS